MRESDGQPAQLTGAVKAAYTQLRYMPYRMLHRRRHADVREKLRGLGDVRSILVVCYANVCRSPYLQAILGRELPAVNVISAGLAVSYRPVPPHALLLAAKRGLDLSAFRSRPLSRVNARGFDLVIVMDSAQRSHVARVSGVSPSRIIVAGDLDPEPSATRAIADPWGKSLEAFADSFDRLDRCAATISAVIQHSQRSSRTSSP